MRRRWKRQAPRVEEDGRKFVFSFLQTKNKDKMVQDLMEALELATRAGSKKKKKTKYLTVPTRRRKKRRAGDSGVGVWETISDEAYGATSSASRKRELNHQVSSAFGAKQWEGWKQAHEKVLSPLGYACAAAAALYAAETCTGCVSMAARAVGRRAEKLLANMSDVPLFTPDGEEPPTAEPKWTLPGARRRRGHDHHLGGPSSSETSEGPAAGFGDSLAHDPLDNEGSFHRRHRRTASGAEYTYLEERPKRIAAMADSESGSVRAASASLGAEGTVRGGVYGGHGGSNAGSAADLLSSSFHSDQSCEGGPVAHALADRSGSLRSGSSLGGSGSGSDPSGGLSGPFGSENAGENLPHFFSSTKLLACLDLEESRALFESARIIRLAPEETLFHTGDPSDGGTYIVVEGSLGVFQTDQAVDQTDQAAEDNLKPMHTNTLQEGESVGDLDLVDGHARSVTCVALEEGAVLVEISRELFRSFVLEKPRALQVYLQQAIARLWRVAHFVLNDTLKLPQSRSKNEMFDTVPSEDVGLMDGELLSLLLEKQVGQHVCLPTGVSLYEEGTPADAFYVLLKGKMLIERNMDGVEGHDGGSDANLAGRGHGGQQRGRRCTADIVSPHCIIGSTAYFTSTVRRQSVRALEFSELVAIGVVELEKLRVTSKKAFISLLVTASRAMGPLIRKFISLGLNRVWLHAHDIPFRQGDTSSSIYITISGRMILAHQDERTGKVQTEEVAGRGEAIGAVWSLANGRHKKTAMCTRDSELVRMSRGAFQCISTKYPAAAMRLLEGMAQRMSGSRISSAGGLGSGRRKRVATVALIPLAGQTKLCEQVASQLKQALQKLGPTLLLSGGKVGMAFPLVAERLSNRFYRSKLTAWMAAQEEDYTYIILQADASDTEWSKICVAQADCVLLTTSSDGVDPAVQQLEHNLVWRHVKKTKPTLTEVALKAQSFRVELLLVHNGRAPPTGTARWLEGRKHWGLERHHHMVSGDAKDLERLARWLSGKAVGLVLSGGGSRGLAHLGVLRALDDAGVPVDIVGGTSQGAFMAALFAQRLPWDRMFACVQDYAAGLGSFRNVMKDLTLPVLSLFAGKGFSALVADCLKYGPENIEDLWLRFFCVSTNVSRGEPSVHEWGPLATLVRASMTVVGLLPPVYHEGDLLVDGGYLNNIPVDVMRTQMGVDTLIVVDVEDKDFCNWKDLKPYREGLSGFFLLWESLCSLVSRKPFRYPRYGEMINSLLFLSHKQQIRTTMRDFHVDLYMQPTGVQFYRLMDYHLMDRIVRDAYRYGWTKVAEWTASTQAESGTTNTMRLRTRSISKVHSQDFVRTIRPATLHSSRGQGETSVSRIQSALAERNRQASASPAAGRQDRYSPQAPLPRHGDGWDGQTPPGSGQGSPRRGDLGAQGAAWGGASRAQGADPVARGHNGMNGAATGAKGQRQGQGPVVQGVGDGLGDGCGLGEEGGKGAGGEPDFFSISPPLKRKVKSCAVITQF